MSLVIANIPFIKSGRNGQIFTGPNAGSRWPFTLPGLTAYTPFPFFMSWATSYLRRHGVDAQFYDGVALKRWDFQAVRRDLAGLRPTILALETATPTYNIIREFAIWAKQSFGSRIVLTGPHVASFADQILQEPWVDHVVAGEYEKPLLEIARHGAAAPRKFVYDHVEDLDEIDGEIWLPHRPLEYLYNYWDASMPTGRAQLAVSTSRGCPFKCTYCQWPKVMNDGSYRFRRPDVVLEEIKRAIADYRSFLDRRSIYLTGQATAAQFEQQFHPYQADALRRHYEGILPGGVRYKPTEDDSAGIRSIFFDDDTWNLGVERVKQLCKGLKDIGLPWTMMGRIDTVPLPVYDLMVESGCVGMRFGVESFSQKLLDNTKKHLSSQKSYDNIKYLITRFSNIEFHFTTMKNLPGETDQDWQKDLELLHSLQLLGNQRNNRVHWQNSDCVAFPGTELWEEMVALGKGGELMNFELYDGGAHNTDKLAAAVGWLGSNYQAKWSKYSKMGDPTLLPADSREAIRPPPAPAAQGHPLPVISS
jgi:radical SAM superfamily enzyme YgiQ (UPF0313 family)